jgi:hypothetical protein
MNPYPFSGALVRKDANGFSLLKGLLKGKESILLGNNDLPAVSTVPVDQSFEVFIFHGPNHDDEGNPDKGTDIWQEFPIPEVGCHKDASARGFVNALCLLEKSFELARGPFDRFPRIVRLEEGLVFHNFKAREKKGFAALPGDSFDFLLGLLRAKGILEVLQGSPSSFWKTIVKEISK